MDKEEALLEFLKGLRICLNNASAYFKGHPFYVKSVNEFKAKVDILLTFINPIKISIAPESLFIDGKSYDKPQLFTEIAAMFHIRKIKNIEMREGITSDELTSFLGAIALAPKEALKRGGVGNILGSGKFAHCFVEDLDYSQLLAGTGEEAKDVWTYLFGEAAQKKDEQAIERCVENFGSVFGSFKAKDLVEDEELRKNICGFLACLKDERKDKFNACSKDMFKAVMKYKGVIEPEQVEKIKAFFKDVNEEQFADLLLDGLTKDDNFDALSLQVFSKLAGEERQRNISLNFLNKVAGKDPLKENPRAAKRVKELLFGTDTQAVSEVYRNVLASLLKDITLEKGVSFDRAQLHLNYRYILLNLLEEERNKEKLGLIISKLTDEWANIVDEHDTKYLRFLVKTEKRAKQENPEAVFLFEDLDKRICGFIEHLMWEEEPSLDLPYLIEALERSASEASFYLNRFFVEQRFSPASLKLFFKSFPGEKEEFLRQLEKKRIDLNFLSKMISGLTMVDCKTALEILVRIYSFSNELVRIQVLKQMQGLPEISFGFVISVLQKGSGATKKEALAILSRDPQLRKEAVNVLLGILSPLGIYNALLIENLGLIDAAGFKEAQDFLYFLRNKRYCWNRNIRKIAQEILEKWNAGKDRAVF